MVSLVPIARVEGDLLSLLRTGEAPDAVVTVAALPMLWRALCSLIALPVSASGPMLVLLVSAFGASDSA